MFSILYFLNFYFVLIVCKLEEYCVKTVKNIVSPQDIRKLPLPPLIIKKISWTSSWFKSFSLMYVVWWVRPKELQCLKHYLVNLNCKYSFKDAIQRCHKILKISWSFGIQPKCEMYKLLARGIKFSLVFLLICPCTSPIMRLICPPKFCTSIVFSFSWGSCNIQKKWKTKVMQNLGGGGGQKMCIMG